MLLEEGLPLSQSALWGYQRRFYMAQGVAAWRHDMVPHYITCNPYIAESYARLAAGFVRDWQPYLDPSQPLYMIELGAGSGRFAYLFLRAWLAQVEAADLQDVPVTYVITDLAQRNVAFWQAHPALAPFFHSDLLDVATFDLACDEPLQLQRSGRILAPGQVANPVVVIANYVFDSIPQDLYFVHDGEVYAGLTRLTSVEDDVLPSEDELLWHDNLNIFFAPADEPVAADAYGDPVLDEILASYAGLLDENQAGDHDEPYAFTFPVGAYHVWRSFLQLAQSRVLLLSADKGYMDAATLRQNQEAGLAFHGGGFSLDVNYHALDLMVQKQGGHVMHGGAAPARIVTSAYWGQEPPGGAHATRCAALETLGTFGPDDYYALVKGIEPRYAALTVPQVLALLRLSRNDPRVLYGCLPALQANIDAISPAQRAEILARVASVWDNYYHIEEEGDLPYGLGKLCISFRAWTEAIFYLEQSNLFYGDNAHVCYEMAQCLLDLGRKTEAIGYLDRALAQMPAHGQALTLRKQVAA